MNRIIPCMAMAIAGLSASAQSPAEKKATIAYIQKYQLEGGGYAATLPASGAASLRATSSAVRAIKYLGGQTANKAGAAKFVQSCYDSASGGFADSPGGKPDVVVTAVGLMAAAELLPDFDAAPAVKYMAANAKTFEERRLAVAGMEAVKKFAPEIQDWFGDINKGRNDDGSYGHGAGQARETGGVVAMILRSGGQLTPDQRTGALAALRAGQRADGGFGKADATASDPETTYRVMRAFYLLKERPSDVEKLTAYLGKNRNADGGYGIAPGQASSLSGTYFAAVVGYWLGK